MQIFPQEVTLGFQIEFFHGSNATFFCSSDEGFITPLALNRETPFRVVKTQMSGVQIPVSGAVSVVIKIYYKGNFVRYYDMAGESYNFLNEWSIPSDLAAKPANSRKRAREPSHEIEWSDVRSPEEDMIILNIKRWEKKNYVNLAELSLVVQNIGSSDGLCELTGYECVIHIENKEMQDFILREIKTVQ